MQRLGFIHDMLDVKVLILFVASRANYPMTVQEIYETCYVDDCLSYFDVCTAIPEMVNTGHLRECEEGKYLITDLGRADGETTADSIAFTVRQKAENLINRFNRNIRRSSFVKTQIIPRDNGEYSVTMTLELVAPNQRQAVRLSRMFEKKAETIYNLTMNELLSAEEELED